MVELPVHAEHSREVCHRMPTTNGNVLWWQFVQLDETAVSRNSKNFEVVDDRRIEAALRLGRPTCVADHCDVGVALRVITVGRAHESMREVNRQGDVLVVRPNVERSHERGMNRVHDRDLLGLGVGLSDMNADTWHEGSSALGIALSEPRW